MEETSSAATRQDTAQLGAPLLHSQYGMQSMDVDDSAVVMAAMDKREPENSGGWTEAIYDAMTQWRVVAIVLGIVLALIVGISIGRVTAAPATAAKLEKPALSSAISEENQQSLVDAIADAVFARGRGGDATHGPLRPPASPSSSSSSPSSSSSSPSSPTSAEAAATAAAAKAAAAAARGASSAAMRDFKGRRFALTSGKHGAAVASDVGDCSELGAALMRNKGGNAVDAAVTVALCIGVVNPASSGLFGGSFMVLRMRKDDGSFVEEFIDMRESAPAAANATMYESKSSSVGALAVAVPCELKGYFLAHSRHGRLSWREVVQPVLDLARRGFELPPYTAHSLVSSWSTLSKDKVTRSIFGVRKSSNGDTTTPSDAGASGPVRVGSVVINWRQVETLQEIAERGPAALYDEEAAQAIAAEIQQGGGIITAEDLMRVEPVLREPARAENIFGFDIITASPPSSGALVILMLRLLERQMQPPLGASISDQSLSVHKIVESMKHAFSMRMSMSDPGRPGVDDFMGTVLCEEVLEKLLDPEFADDLAASIANNTLPLDEYGLCLYRLPDNVDDAGTAAFSVIDEDGSAVSMTSTVNWGFGAKFMSETGIVFNNEMDDFSVPGRPNGFGVAPSEENFVEPLKRPQSSMSPTIILRDGEVVATVGASGGPRIISAVLQTIVRLIIYGDGPLDALTAPRVHHQFLPNRVDVEDIGAFCSEDATAGGSISDAVGDALAARGHEVRRLTTRDCSSEFGVAQVITRDPLSGAVSAASDPRKGGAPAVV